MQCKYDLLNISIEQYRAFRQTPGSRLLEMIIQWMRSDCSASWEHLATALSKVQTYKLATANQLRQAVGLPAGDVCYAHVVTIPVSYCSL